MSVSLDHINALFKDRFGEGPVETIRETPYFLKMVKAVKISKNYTVPINLRPGHSMLYSGNAYEKVNYKAYQLPVIKEAKGEISAKFFKVEIPLGVIDSLNKNNTEDGLAYQTAKYFINDAVRTNQLLAELSYMFGDEGLPEIIGKRTTYNGQPIASSVRNPLVLTYNTKTTSEAAVRILLNGRIKLANQTYIYTVVDINDSEILLSAPNHAARNVSIPATGTRIYIETQKDNDNLGLYQLMNASGEVLGINSDQYRNWKPNSFDIGNSKLTLAKVKEAATMLITKGGVMNEDLVLFIAQETWDNLSTEIDSARRFDSSYRSEANTVGQRKVGIMHSNGMIELRYHPLMKRNTAFLMTNPTSKDNLITLTTDQVMTFENNKNFKNSENSSSAYIIGKMYFAPFMHDRRRHVLLTNITNE
ncbi:hypothetical protein COTS27_01038 [Spirochaetota bacterium]|nr:hypothetical protein COTS27_01038 [Spirochaetota bacterium]